MRTLEHQRYNLGKTADALSLSRHALRYRIQRLNINVGNEDEDETASQGSDQGS